MPGFRAVYLAPLERSTQKSESQHYSNEQEQTKHKYGVLCPLQICPSCGSSTQKFQLWSLPLKILCGGWCGAVCQPIPVLWLGKRSFFCFSCMLRILPFTQVLTCGESAWETCTHALLKPFWGCGEACRV